MWALLYTPIGILKYEKLSYRITRFSTLLNELIAQKFSGYVEILAPHEHGLLILYNGKVYNSFYEGTEDISLLREEVVGHFLRTETKERETIINVGELAPRMIVALGALEPRDPAHRELETIFLDLNRLFETLARKHFTGALRFYQIRNNTRLGNILLRLEKITADQLREAIRLQLSEVGALRLGDALVQSGAIGKQDLEYALDRQSNTRKGSDIELAMALFSEGEFLGGYRQADKKIVSNRQEVFRWLGTAETLMDIIDGLLPSEIDIKRIMHPRKTPEVEQPVVLPKKKTQPKPKVEPESKTDDEAREKTALDDYTIRELTEETFMLKADDLILDIHPHPAGPLTSDSADDAPADSNLAWLDNLVNKSESQGHSPPLQTKDQENAERVAERLTSKEKSAFSKKVSQAEEKVVPPAESPAARHVEVKTESQNETQQLANIPPGKGIPDVHEKSSGPETKKESAAIPVTKPGEEISRDQKQTQVQELEVLEKVLKEYMGFLGVALLEREVRYLEVPEAGNINRAQLKNINQHLFHSISLIAGAKAAEMIRYEIEERIGG